MSGLLRNSVWWQPIPMNIFFYLIKGSASWDIGISFFAREGMSHDIKLKWGDWVRVHNVSFCFICLLHDPHVIMITETQRNAIYSKMKDQIDTGYFCYLDKKPNECHVLVKYWTLWHWIFSFWLYWKVQQHYQRGRERGFTASAFVSLGGHW